MTSPYYENPEVTVHHDDCMTVMSGMADGSVAAVMTDPPYEERTHKFARTNKRGEATGQRPLAGKAASFASITDGDLRDVLAECGRVSSGWVIATLAYQHAFALETDPPPGLRVLRIGVWVKTDPMPQISADRPGQGWEAIAYMHRDDVKPAWNGGGRHGNHIGPCARNEGHPTAKPLDMLRTWVDRFTKPGDTILDPFAGSGTTLRAALDGSRRAVGIEAREDYCELIVRRVAQTALDLHLPA